MPLAKAAPRIDVNALLPWRALTCNRNMPVTGEDAATSLEQKFEPGRSERKHRLFEKDHLTAGVPCPGLTGLLRVMTPCLRAESPSAVNRAFQRERGESAAPRTITLEFALDGLLIRPTYRDDLAIRPTWHCDLDFGARPYSPATRLKASIPFRPPVSDQAKSFRPIRGEELGKAPPAPMRIRSHRMLRSHGRSALQRVVAIGPRMPLSHFVLCLILRRPRVRARHCPPCSSASLDQ
jgi:hypothetical protein